VVILTKSYLRRPFYVAELVAAHRAGILIISVFVRGIDREFDFQELVALDEDGIQFVMDDLGWRILENQKLSREEVWAAIQRLKEIITLPFSPNASSAVQSAEIDAILDTIRSSVKDTSVRGATEQAPVAIAVDL